MSYDLHSVARQYVDKRFPRATQQERDKIVADWVGKMVASRSIVKDLEKRAGTIYGKKILDAGCGNGGVSIAIAEQGGIPTGVEIERELYDIAKLHASEYGKPIEFLLYDGRILPLESEVFDGAISVSVLEHTYDPVLYLQEILRVTKPGGFLYLAFPNRLWPKETHTGIWFLTYFPRQWMSMIVSWLGRNPLEDNNLHFYTYRDLNKMLGEACQSNYHWAILPEAGTSQSGVKFALKKLLFLLGVPHRALLPHIMVILKKVECQEKR